MGRLTLIEGALSELKKLLQGGSDELSAETALWLLAQYAKSKQADVEKAMEVCQLLLQRLAPLQGMAPLICSACALVEAMPRASVLPALLDRRLTEPAQRGAGHAAAATAVATAAHACCASSANELWLQGSAVALAEELQSRALAGEEGLVAAAAELLAVKDVRPLASHWAQLCMQASPQTVVTRAKAFLSTIVNLDVCTGLWVDCISMLQHVPLEARVNFVSRSARFAAEGADPSKGAGVSAEFIANVSQLWISIWAQVEGDASMIAALAKLVQASARTTPASGPAIEALIHSFERAHWWPPQSVDAALCVVEATVAPSGSAWPLTRALASSYERLLALAAALAERQPVAALPFIGALASWGVDSEDGAALRSCLRAQAGAVRFLLAKGEDRRLAERIASALVL